MMMFVAAPSHQRKAIWGVWKKQRLCDDFRAQSKLVHSFHSIDGTNVSFFRLLTGRTSFTIFREIHYPLSKQTHCNDTK
jgi:hypothetical protein